MTPRFTPRARDDLRDILAYLETKSAVTADRVRSEFSRTLALIVKRPEIGVRNEKDPTLRSFPLLRYPYRVHYFVEGLTIWIVHIRHLSRRPWVPDIKQNLD